MGNTLLLGSCSDPLGVATKATRPQTLPGDHDEGSPIPSGGRIVLGCLSKNSARRLLAEFLIPLVAITGNPRSWKTDED